MVEGCEVGLLFYVCRGDDGSYYKLQKWPRPESWREKKANNLGVCLFCVLLKLGILHLLLRKGGLKKTP